MRNFNLILILLLVMSKALTQSSKICYVEYINYNIESSWYFPHWFDIKKQIYTSDVTYKVYEFPVIKENGNIFKSTDSITYWKEYKRHLNFLLSTRDTLYNPYSSIDYGNNIIKKVFYLDKIKYLIRDTIKENIQWTLHNETDSILGFKCQVAHTYFKNKKWKAYFTTSLPFPAGPQWFTGLPGLILKIINENENTGYLARTIIYPYNGKVPIINEDGIPIAKEEYIKRVNEFNEKQRGKLSGMLLTPKQIN